MPKRKCRRDGRATRGGAAGGLLVLLAFGPACGSSNARSPSGTDVGDASASSGEGSDAGGASAASEAGSVDVLDGEAPPSDAALLGEAGLPRSFTVSNQCAQTVWAAALPATTFPGGIVAMAPGSSFQVRVDNGWSGRIWGKTGCTTTGGKTTCASDAFPASLAELTLTKSATGLDFYDVSLVDGFNLPIALDAVGHAPNAAHPYDCGSPACAANLLSTCAAAFQDSAGGEVIACANDACKLLGDDDAAAPSCVYPNQYTEFFKTACPQAYSYPSDDPTSTFTCEGYNDYAVVFCP